MSAAEGRVLRRAAALLRGDAPRRDLAWRALAQIGYRRLWLFGSLPRETDPALPEGIEVRPVGLPQLDAYLAADPRVTGTEVRRRLEAGYGCLALWKQGRIVSLSWWSSGVTDVPYLGLTIEPAPGVEYRFDAYTPAEARRLRLHRLLVAVMNRQTVEAGRDALAYLILPENRGMLATLPPYARRVGVVASVALGPRRVPLRFGGDGYLTRVRAARPLAEVPRPPADARSPAAAPRRCPRRS